MTSEIPTSLTNTKISRYVSDRQALILARQGFEHYGDLHRLTDEELSMIPGVSSQSARILISTRSILTNGNIPPATKRESAKKVKPIDPVQDVLFTVACATSEQMNLLEAVSVDALGLTERQTVSLGCRTLAEVVSLPQETISALSPSVFEVFRRSIIQALDGVVFHKDPESKARSLDRSIALGYPLTIMPALMTEKLRQIPTAGLNIPDWLYRAFIEDGLKTGYDIVARDRARIVGRYRMTTKMSSDLQRSLRGRLVIAYGPACARLISLQVKECENLFAWLGRASDVIQSETPLLALDPRQQEALRSRPVRHFTVGLTHHAAEALIRAGITDLAMVAGSGRDHLHDLTGLKDDSLSILARRLASLGQFGGPADGFSGQDIDVLQDDGIGADLCEILALANLPTLRTTASADLSAVPGFDSALAALVRKAIFARYSRTKTDTAHTSTGQNLVDVSDSEMTWLKHQPVSSLIGPGIGKGTIHRLRQNGYSDLSRVASAERSDIASIRTFSPAIVDLITARIIQILEATALRDAKNRRASA